MMTVEIVRLERNETVTHGFVKVYDEGDPDKVLMTCHSLEPRVRSEKIWGKTAIPPGEYRVQFSWSNKFKGQMPYLMDVPNFSGVMIHVGNYARDTQGCILVGDSYGNSCVNNSRVTFNRLMTIIRYQQVKVVIVQPGYWGRK